LPVLINAIPCLPKKASVAPKAPFELLLSLLTALTLNAGQKGGSGGVKNNSMMGVFRTHNR